jgi:FMN-dependent NADH-azoreductase
MPTLLHVSASPRGGASESLALATTFLDAYLPLHPDVTVDTFDLHDGTLPVFGRLAAGAKMAVLGGGQPSADQATAWDAARTVFDRFAATDAYLFSVPMWNASVPYVLKQWIDIITQPGWVFGFTPADGYTGLITGRKAAVVYTSGIYSPGRAASLWQRLPRQLLQRLAAFRRDHRRNRDPLPAHRADRHPRRRPRRRSSPRCKRRKSLLTRKEQRRCPATARTCSTARPRFPRTWSTCSSGPSLATHRRRC